MSLNCAVTKGEQSLNAALNNLMSSFYPPFITKNIVDIKERCEHMKF